MNSRLASFAIIISLGLFSTTAAFANIVRCPATITMKNKQFVGVGLSGYWNSVSYYIPSGNATLALAHAQLNASYGEYGMTVRHESYPDHKALYVTCSYGDNNTYAQITHAYFGDAGDYAPADMPIYKLLGPFQRVVDNETIHQASCYSQSNSCAVDISN